MKQLIGKRVWVVQFDDAESSISGFVHAVEDGFIAISERADQEPVVYVNLARVSEIEVVPPNFDLKPRAEGRLLRLPGITTEDIPS